MEKYNFKLLNFWNNEDDLYVNYVVSNNDTSVEANIIKHFNTSDIGCDYNNSSKEEIEKCLLKLIKEDSGYEFDLPKLSELSNLLKDIYLYVCENDSNMCHITEEEWREFAEENNYNEDDIDNLKKEIKKYKLDDYITVDEDGYKICGYGGLQCCFNDDIKNRRDNFER